MTNKKISHHEQCHMAIWHCSHPNIAMLDNRVCKDTISSRDVSSAVLSEMSNIYHEGCPLYRTSTEHICNLLSVPITMRIISRLLAEQPRSKVLWLLVQNMVDHQRYWSMEPAAILWWTILPVWWLNGNSPNVELDWFKYHWFLLLEHSIWCLLRKNWNWVLPCRDTAPLSSLTSSCPWCWYSYLFLLNSSPKRGDAVTIYLKRHWQIDRQIIFMFFLKIYIKRHR